MINPEQFGYDIPPGIVNVMKDMEAEIARLRTQNETLLSIAEKQEIHINQLVKMNKLEAV